MSNEGPGTLHRVQGRLNRWQYIDILENVFLPAAQQRFGEEVIIPFVHDNCPAHKAKEVKDWFEDHPEIAVIEWPPKAQDLNPIENAWAMLKARSEPQKYRNQEELFANAEGIWNALADRPLLWTDLVSSMPDRLNDCVAEMGGWTKY